MKHLTITDLQNGYFRIIPKKGYKLKNKIIDSIHSEAIVKNPEMFEAIK